jgi:hypothetical protein
MLGVYQHIPDHQTSLALGRAKNAAKKAEVENTPKKTKKQKKNDKSTQQQH